jgi:subfamily B ATP-binding cassette protein MsbA
VAAKPAAGRRLFRYLAPYRFRFLLGLVTTALASVLDGVTVVLLIPLLQHLFGSAGSLVATSTPLEQLVNSTLAPLLGGVSPGSATVRLVLLLAAGLLLKNGFSYLSGIISVQIQEGVVRDLRAQLFRHLLRLDLGFLQQMRGGQLVARVTQDADAAKGAVSAGLASFFQNLVVIVTTVGVLTQISWRLTLLALATAPVLLFAVRRVLSRLRRLSRARADEAGEMTATVTERLAAIKLIRTYDGTEREATRFHDQANRYRRKAIRTQSLATLTSPLTEVFGGALLVLLIVAGAAPAFTGGSLSPEALMVFLVAALKLMAPLKGITQVPNQMAMALASAERVFEVLDRPEPEVDPPQAQLATFERDAVFESVWFRYPDGLAGGWTDRQRRGKRRSPRAKRESPETSPPGHHTAEEWVLQDISFSLPKGAVVALVGPSGGGKTTLADLLPRLHDPVRGRILLDGVPLTQLGRSSLRAMIGVVGQEALLLNDTVRANIAYGRPAASAEAIEAAARAANAHGFISRLPEGYDTLVGERGARLSGGQRQRIAIARALLKDPPLLILDEATSALDTESERLVHEAIDRLMQARTVLVIAHRLSTVRHADLILVLEQGQIVERGSHAELLARRGRYHDLYHSQWEQVPKGTELGVLVAQPDQWPETTPGGVAEGVE